MTRMPASQRGSGPRVASLRIMLVDDHPMWRETLRKVLEHKKVGRIVAEASDGYEAVERATDAVPDVVVMDVDLPGLDGVETTRRLLDARPDAKVLVLSASDAKDHVVAAVRAGASGYLVKTAASEEVADAIRRVHAGESVFPPALMDIVLQELRRTQPDIPEVRLAVAAPGVVAREGLVRVLREAGFDVAGSGSLDELGDLVETEPDLVLADIGRGVVERLDAVLALRRAHPGLRVLVLSDDPRPAEAVALLGDGSPGLGYLLTERFGNLEELSDAIRRVAKGESVIEPDVVTGLVRRDEPSPLDELTDGERAVLELMAEGRSNQAISSRLHLSLKTVEARVASIFSKLMLAPAPDDHRRVLAVLAYLRSVAAPDDSSGL